MEDPTLLKRNGTGFHEKEKTFAATTMQYIRNGTAFYWASFFVLILIEFFLGGQLSKILTRQNYSLYVIVLNTLPFYNVLVNIGISYVIIYMVSYNEDIRYKLFRSSLKLQTIWYIFLVAVHLLLFLFFRTTITECLLITIIISYSYSYRLNLNSFFLGTHSYSQAAISNGLQKTGLLVLVVIISYVSWLKDLLNNHFVPAYSAIEVSVVLLYFIIFWKTNYASFKAPVISYRRRILKYGKYSMLNNGMNVFYYLIIAFIIRSSQLDPHTKIVMSLCIVFFRYTGAVVAPFVSITIPQFTRIKNDLLNVKKLYQKHFVFILMLSLFTLIGCRFLFGYVINQFYAASYHDIPEYFYFFCYLIPLLFLNALNTQLIAALGKIKFTFKVEFICTLILVLFYAWNLQFPIVNFHILYYMVLIHLAAKFVMINYGLYQVMFKK